MDDEHPEFGNLFDPEEEHESESRRPSHKVLVLMAVTGLIIVVIAVAAGISAVTDKGSDNDPVTTVRVGGPIVGDLAATTTPPVPATEPTSTSAAPEEDPFEAELASRSATVPRMDELTELEARGHARTMCLRLDSRVPEEDILKEAEDGGLNPAVAGELLEIAKLTVCPEHGDGSTTATP